MPNWIPSFFFTLASDTRTADENLDRARGNAAFYQDENPDDYVYTIYLDGAAKRFGIVFSQKTWDALKNWGKIPKDAPDYELMVFPAMMGGMMQPVIERIEELEVRPDDDVDDDLREQFEGLVGTVDALSQKSSPQDEGPQENTPTGLTEDDVQALIDQALEKARAEILQHMDLKLANTTSDTLSRDEIVEMIEMGAEPASSPPMIFDEV